MMTLEVYIEQQRVWEPQPASQAVFLAQTGDYVGLNHNIGSLWMALTTPTPASLLGTTSPTRRYGMLKEPAHLKNTSPMWHSMMPPTDDAQENLNACTDNVLWG